MSDRCGITVAQSIAEMGLKWLEGVGDFGQGGTGHPAAARSDDRLNAVEEPEADGELEQSHRKRGSPGRSEGGRRKDDSEQNGGQAQQEASDSERASIPDEEGGPVLHWSRPAESRATALALLV
jgi:hypothetical protein